MKKTYLSIQYIRAIACMMVVLFHFRGTINNVYPVKDIGNMLFRWGEIGVDAFFIISGFIISYATMHKESLSVFYIKRFFRIYPAYLLAIVLLYPVFETSGFARYFIDSLLLKPIDESKGSPFWGYQNLTVAWSLLYEVVFYIIYGACMIASHKHRNIICCSVIILICFTSQLAMTGSFMFGPGGGAEINSFPQLSAATSSMMLTFIIGIILFEICNFLVEKNIKISKGIMIKSIALSTCFFFACYFNGFFSWHGVNRSVIFIAPIVFSIVIYDCLYGIGNCRILSFLGDKSYSLYLFHTIVPTYMFIYLGSEYRDLNGVAKLAVILSASICFSYIASRFVETPSVRISRKLIGKFKGD